MAARVGAECDVLGLIVDMQPADFADQTTCQCPVEFGIVLEPAAGQRAIGRPDDAPFSAVDIRPQDFRHTAYVFGERLQSSACGVVVAREDAVAVSFHRQDVLQELLGDRDLAVEHGCRQVGGHQHGEDGAEDSDHGETGDGEPDAQVEPGATHGRRIDREDRSPPSGGTGAIVCSPHV